MKAMKTLIATGAMLAVFAPVAHANFDSVAAPKTHKAKAARVVKVSKVSKASHHAVTTAKKTGSAASTGVTYILVTSPIGTQIPAQGDDCESNDVNCTPAEACSYWGENCDQIDGSQPSQPADGSSMQDQTPAG